MKYGLKLVAFKGDTIDLWVYDGRNQVILDSLEDAKETIKRYTERSPIASYRLMVIPETDPNGDNILEDVFAPKGFRYKDGMHVRAVHSEEEAEMAVNEPLDPCPDWCSCKKREKPSFAPKMRARVEYQRPYRY